MSYRRALSALATLMVCAAAATVLSTAPQPPTAFALDNTPWRLPTVPPTCSSTQLAAGTVAGCVVMGGAGQPPQYGWPTPPFPATVSGQPFPPAGWVWNGYTYNGSPALAGWELQFARNASAIGTLATNKLVTAAVIQPLFEGFLREVNVNGYAIRDGYAYSFRCTTSSTANCYTLTSAKLSNHAYGLAMDINSGTNPVRTYAGINGATACATPMVTDIPQWVVQTAEKWGLYWGGYGWSSGCTSPAQQKTSASRDPTHFEFRGTVDQAKRILAVNMGWPLDCHPTVTDSGSPSERCIYPNEMLPAGTRLVVNAAPPAGATHALVNVTGLGAASTGMVTAESCASAAAGARPTATTAVNANRVMGNAAVVALDAAGRFCVYLGVPTHVIVDVQGYFASAAAAPTGLAFTSVPTARLLNTRQSPYCTPEGACAAGPIPAGTEVALSFVGAPAGTQAVVANVAVVDAGGRGYLTGDRCDVLQPGPQLTSNVNAVPGMAASNLAALRAVEGTGQGAGAVVTCLTASVSGNVIVDTQGFFAPPSNSPNGLGLVSTTPTRMVDTSGCWVDALTNAQRCGLLNAAGSIVAVNAPAGATAVVVNITSWAATSGGYITAGPCASLVAGPQATATSTFNVGATSSNMAIVPVDANGRVCFYTSASSHLAVDVQARLSAAGTGLFTPVAATRLTDTRPGR